MEFFFLVFIFIAFLVSPCYVYAEIPWILSFKSIKIILENRFGLVWMEHRDSKEMKIGKKLKLVSAYWSRMHSGSMPRHHQPLGIA